MHDKNRWKQCDNCSKRNCHKIPPKKERCTKKIPMQEGWSFFEVALDNTPAEVMTVLHEAKLAPITHGKKVRFKKI